MKILYLNILYAPHVTGGVEHTLKALAEGMSARGHQVTVLTTGPEPGLHREIINGVQIIRTGVHNLYWHAIREKPAPWKRALWHLLDIYNYPMGRVVSEVLSQVKPDLVSIHNLAGFSVAAWGAIHQTGIPIVQVLHDHYLLCPGSNMFRDNHICRQRCTRCRLMRCIHPMLSKKVSGVVGVSNFILKHHLQSGLFKEAPIKQVIHDARKAPAAISTSPRKKRGKIHFGYIGTLAPNKGIELLLRVFQNEKESDWQLDIAGSGPAPYEKYLRDSYACDDIIFHGVQRQDEFYPNIDVLVVPSLWNEPLGGVVFEGLSYGIPVIGAQRGGIPEMIQPGINGLLFDPDKPNDLNSALRKMALDNKFRAAASQAALDTSKYFTDFTRFLGSYEKIYEQLCGIETGLLP